MFEYCLICYSNHFNHSMTKLSNCSVFVIIYFEVSVLLDLMMYYRFIIHFRSYKDNDTEKRRTSFVYTGGMAKVSPLPSTKTITDISVDMNPRPDSRQSNANIRSDTTRPDSRQSDVNIRCVTNSLPPLQHSQVYPASNGVRFGLE